MTDSIARTSNPVTCTWEADSAGWWSSGCGQSDLDIGAHIGEVNFCCFCGKPASKVHYPIVDDDPEWPDRGFRDVP